MLTPKDRKLFARLLKEHSHFIVSGHHKPDGDVVGSTLALVIGLKQLKKKVIAYNADGCPDWLTFLPSSKIMVDVIPPKFKGVLITVDSGDLGRLGDAIQNFKFQEIWNVDHHQSNTKFGDRNFIDVQAGSTGQVVYELLKDIRGFKLTKDISQLLFCTLSTDTGSFKYQNATTEVFSLASTLVEHGAQPDFISRSLYDTFPKSRLLLMARAFNSVKFEFDGRVAKMWVTDEDLVKAGAKKEDIEGLVNFPRAVEGVEVSCLFKETGHDQWTLSFRSRDQANVLPLAEALGGGGHMRAAGCTVKGSRINVESQVDALLRKYKF